jgi:hypothetical protein
MAFDAGGDLFVAAGGSVVEYAPPLVASSPAIATITGGIANATAVVLDPDANLFVGNSAGSANAVTEYAPPYTGAPIAVSTRHRARPHAAAGPVALMLDRANQLWVLNGDGTVTVSAPPYGAPTAIAPPLATVSAFTIGP